MSSQNFIKEHYDTKVVEALKKSRGYTNVYQIPRIEKVVLNMGVSALLDKGVMEESVKNMGLITGQRPIKTIAKKSIANFKLREEMPIGVKVTLRGERMWDFLLRLIAVALPSIRDFRGIPSKFDGNGNFSLGVTDITIFPEISVDSIKRQSGLEFTIVTSANTDEEGYELLDLLGMPFRKREEQDETSNDETAA
ncbi:MAG: 50S ribosomal protein L5 [Opitutales bacterium]|jgi:large subunit ribosomal protein L5|nr:50S ribosomal protein L5 [Opitutales bacterium]MDG2253628.1 50S ribosomal protein L5 [Opitutaceae bacterium]MBT5814363.1 50S ribosomal protein L5 [Opitutales bacterium]MBT6381536.1 50S ribosomal protein L5 [Opitutales bacterium]MBT6770484.1 50S ribosomal protein L5 [Opitutales bacterium]